MCVVVVCDFSSICLRGQGGLGCIYIHACMYASMQRHPPPTPHSLPPRPFLSLSFPPSLSIYHASIGLSASGMRCGERGRGEGYMGRNRNKFSPHLYFKNAHTFPYIGKAVRCTHSCCSIPNMCPPPPSPSQTHTHTLVYPAKH